MNNQRRHTHKYSSPIKVIHAVGARPNFMKIAPVMKEMSKYPEHFNQILVHTGQHYDEEMSHSFFIDLKLPKPDVFLGVGSGSHAEQTAKVMIEFEKVCIEEKPDLVVVVGDVNSTLACALVASKLCIPLAHIEAGLRSFDRTMPEEINRILTDQISDFLFTSCEDANINLQKEGIPKKRVFFVGNTMIDSLLGAIKEAKKSDILEEMGLRCSGFTNRYALVTIHRPSNVDDPERLQQILRALNKLAEEMAVIFPMHPRTAKNINNFDLKDIIDYKNDKSSLICNVAKARVHAMRPLCYIDFLCLMANATIVLTDSGGIQEETTILGVPCLTLRNNTERPITIKEGTNILVGNNPVKIIKTAQKILKKGLPKTRQIKYWDGRAAERINKVFLSSSILKER